MYRMDHCEIVYSSQSPLRTPKSGLSSLELPSSPESESSDYFRSPQGSPQGFSPPSLHSYYGHPQVEGYGSPQMVPMTPYSQKSPSQGIYSTPKFGYMRQNMRMAYSHPQVMLNPTNETSMRSRNSQMLPPSNLPGAGTPPPPSTLIPVHPYGCPSPQYSPPAYPFSQSYPPQSQYLPQYLSSQSYVRPTLQIGASHHAKISASTKKVLGIAKNTKNREVGKVFIENIVATFNLHIEVDLTDICNRLYNVKEGRKTFTACTLQLRSPKASLLIFASGKMVSTGTKNIDDCIRSIRRGARLIQRLGYKPRFFPSDLKIQNVVGTVNLGFKVDLDKLAKLDNTSYEPENFSGAKMSIGSNVNVPEGEKKSNLTMNVFPNGSAVIVGGKTTEEVEKAFYDYKDVLKRHERVKVDVKVVKEVERPK
ncbi:hypothetical protein L596_009717 [Steinernema carpocapsae]|uniref:Uncharacterized protein n=1 Tax=Steinernema carpocapsae TaxID=34508 RepID=A0A4U5PG57_STECR|nr:hypothetical protein L596_009717 [Steinernema carpocapsae]